MSLIYQSAFFEALGWSLIDSLWQMGALWALYSFLTFNGSRHTSSKRHDLALLATIAGTIWFFISLVFNYENAVNDESLYSLAYLFKDSIGNVFENRGFLNAALPLLSFLYLVTVCVFSARLLLQFKVNKKLYRKNLIPADDSVLKFLADLSEQIGITKTIRIWFSEKVVSPLTIGFFRPLIIFPVAAFSQLTSTQAEAVIAHELFHIKRNDYLLNLLITIAEVILFFNPFARILFGIVKKERENSCDDQVLALGFDAWEYSEALYLLGRFRSNHNDLVLAATGKGKEFLLQRVKRIMNRKNPSPSLIKPFCAFFLCLFVAALSGRQPGQVPKAKISGNILPVDNKYVIVTDPVTIHLQNEKKITVSTNEKRTTVVVTKTQIKPRIKHQPENNTLRKENMPSPPSPPLPEEIEQTEITSFVSVPEILEFTMIDIHTPEIPLPVMSESLLPYVPGSTFYYPDIDSTMISGKKVIRL